MKPTVQIAQTDGAAPVSGDETKSCIIIEMQPNLRDRQKPMIPSEAITSFVFLTRPDESPVAVNTAEVLRFSPVPPPTSPLGGPLEKGTRIEFRNGAHQDVKELIDEVAKLLNQGLDPTAAIALFAKQIKALR